MSKIAYTDKVDYAIGEVGQWDAGNANEVKASVNTLYDVAITVDQTVVSGSTNPVAGGAVYTELQGKQAALGYTAENTANKVTAWATPSNTQYPSALLTYLSSYTYTFNDKTANYILVLTDVGKKVRMNVASSNTVTIPPFTSVPFPIGAFILVQMTGAGVTTVTPGSGVTIHAPGNITALSAQYTEAIICQESQDVWGMYLRGLAYTPENSSNRRTAFQVTPDDTHYISEKLAYDQLNLKENVANKVTAFQVTPDDTHYPSEKLTSDQLALKEAIANRRTSFQTTPDDTHYISEKLAYDQLGFKQEISTGFISGLAISINGGDNTKFDIAAGVYEYTDYTNLSKPVSTLINYAGSTANTTSFLTTAQVTYVGLSSTGTIFQSSTPFSNVQRRSYCLIGAVVHTNLTYNNTVNQLKPCIIADSNQIHDIIKMLGYLNITGNVYTPNGANLSLNKSAGVVFGLGLNAGDYTDPHNLSLSAQTLLTFRYRTQTGVEGADATTLNVTQYDVGGTVTTIPGGNSNWTIQHINIFPSNLTRIQYGQTVYGTFAAALAAIPTDPFVVEQNTVDNGIFRFYLILQKNTTDLSAAITAGTAALIQVDKFGNATSSPGISLTSAAIIAALGYTPESTSNRRSTFQATPDDTHYPTEKLLNDNLVYLQGQINAISSIAYAGLVLP